MNVKINIFKGPKKEFENIIPSDIMTLAEFVQKFDAKKNTFHLETNQEKEYFESNEKEHIECLVAFSENYAGITESAVQTFNNILNECEIEKIYLQNPPKSIIKLLEENYKIDEYTYDINGTRISRQKVLRICMSFLEKGKTIK